MGEGNLWGMKRLTADTRIAALGVAVTASLI
jgi:hypothetical protein